MARRSCRIAGVKDRWRLVLAILVYVTLDLSLPGMPGAFVFEPGDSAEGAQVRARAVDETVAMPVRALGPVPGLVQPTFEVRERLAPVPPAEPRGRHLVGRLSHALLDAASLSEDPH